MNCVSHHLKQKNLNLRLCFLDAKMNHGFISLGILGGCLVISVTANVVLICYQTRVCQQFKGKWCYILYAYIKILPLIIHSHFKLTSDGICNENLNVYVIKCVCSSLGKDKQATHDNSSHLLRDVVSKVTKSLNMIPTNMIKVLSAAQAEGEQDLNYAALHFSGGKVTRGRKKNNLNTEESVYAQVKCWTCL